MLRAVPLEMVDTSSVAYMWTKDNIGGKIEHDAAKAYGLKIIYED